eukprot:9877204-Ditylum_brightwellii.AAC.1
MIHMTISQQHYYKVDDGYWYGSTEQGIAAGAGAVFMIIAVGLAYFDSKHFGDFDFVVDGHIGHNIVLLLLL